MSWYSIEKALQKQIESIGLTPTIFYENVKNDASVEPHIRVANLPAKTITLNKTNADQYNGIYQVSLYYLTDTGKKDILEDIDLILSFFRFGSILTEDSCNVFIEESNQNPARVIDKYYVVDISIFYHAYIDRS